MVLAAISSSLRSRSFLHERASMQASPNTSFRRRSGQGWHSFGGGFKMNSRLLFLIAASGGLMACEDPRQIPTGPEQSRRNSAQAPEDLFTLVAAPPLATEQAAHLARVRGRPSSAAVYVGRLSDTPLSLLQQGKAVRFSVSPTRQFIAVGRDASALSPTITGWSGTLQGEPGFVQLVYSNGKVLGWLQAGADFYEFEPLGGGLHALIRVDASKLPPDHAREASSGPPPGTPGPGEIGGPAFAKGGWITGFSAMSSTTTTIKVLVVYTPAAVAAAAADSIADMAMLTALLVYNTQNVYFNSNIDIDLELAYEAQVSYSETNRTMAQHVAALRSTTDGMMDVVHSWRNQYYADVVVLLVDDTDAESTCGQAAQILGTADNAFAVTDWECAKGARFTFTHEIGHIQGARHDRDADPTNTPYEFGHGYIGPNAAFRTIMASACLTCSRVPYFSNPNILYNGAPMGTAQWEDNARVLNTTKQSVSWFRRLLVFINGPSLIQNEGMYAWTADTPGIASTYQWRIVYEDGFQQTLGTAQSQQLFASCWEHENYLFDLFVTVTLGDEVAEDSQRVWCAAQ
jgi:peptidyl-Asp metalloendopeptidase